MGTWYCTVEMKAVVAADTEEHARDAFAKEFGVRPEQYDTVVQVDDEEPADLYWEGG
jgi:hypothetical protein